MVKGKLLTKEREKILSMPILELSASLKNGKLSPVKVLEAYQVSWTSYIVVRFKSIKIPLAIGTIIFLITRQKLSLRPMIQIV